MNRYFFAFCISFFVYTSVIASVVYLANEEDENKALKEVQDVTTVAVSLIQQQSECKKEKTIQQPEEHKKVQKKEVHKSISQPKAVVKELVKEDPEPTMQELLKEVEKEAVQEHADHEELLEKEKRAEELRQMMALQKKELDLFTQELIKKINANKHYPISARRRGIEGDVSVKFVVMANGSVDGVKIIDGKSIFERSTIEAIEDSFPVNVGNSLLEFPKEFQIKLLYVLK